MNPSEHPRDLDLPRFMNNGNLNAAITTVLPERPAVSVAAETAIASHVEGMMAKLAELIQVPNDVPPAGADAALKMTKCFEIVAADVVAIAADRVKAALELQQEAETYKTVLLDAGRVLAARVAAESARAYRLSMILREAREVIAGPAPGEAGTSGG